MNYRFRFTQFQVSVLTARAGPRAAAAGGAGPRRDSPAARRRRRSPPPCTVRRRRAPTQAVPAPRPAPARAACSPAAPLRRASSPRTHRVARGLRHHRSLTTLAVHCKRTGSPWARLVAADSLDIGARGTAGEVPRLAKRRANRVRAARGLPLPPRVVVGLPAPPPSPEPRCLSHLPT